MNNEPYQSAVLFNGQRPGSRRPRSTWYYGQQNLVYNVGDGVSVVTGSNAFTIGPNLNVFANLLDLQRPERLYLRYGNGMPVYQW